MKRTVFIAAVLSALFYGCKKQETLTLKTEDPGLTINQSETKTNNTIQGKTWINYTVHVVDPTKAGKTSAAGLSGATVVLVSNTGTEITATSNTNGFAMFPGLMEGDVNVDVTLAGYTNVHYVTRLYNAQINVTGSTDITENASTDIAIWPLTASVDGYVYGNYNDAGGASITDPGDKNQAVTVKLSFKTVQPFNQAFASGAIISSYIYPAEYSATSLTSGSDAGQFTFSALPAINGSTGQAKLWTVPLRVQSSIGPSFYYYEFKTSGNTIAEDKFNPGSKTFIGIFLLGRTRSDY